VTRAVLEQIFLAGDPLVGNDSEALAAADIHTNFAGKADRQDDVAAGVATTLTKL